MGTDDLETINYNNDTPMDDLETVDFNDDTEMSALIDLKKNQEQTTLSSLNKYLYILGKD